MNIFKALTSGSNYSRIKEESFSSFLAYLLNPSEDHGLSDIFLMRFLGKLDLVNKYKELQSVDVKTEQVTSKGKRIDLKLLFSDPIDETKPDFEIIIENKVKDTTALENDLEHYVLDSETEDSYLILLTPPSWKERGLEKFYELNSENKKHIKWGATDESIITISGIITEILKDESLGNLSPLPNDIIHYLKSLKDFILNYMSLDQEAKRTIDLGNSIQEKTIKLNGKSYLISRYENNTVKVLDIETNDEVTAKPIFREIIREHVPVKLHSEMLDDKALGRKINTRTMGRRLLQWLDENS